MAPALSPTPLLDRRQPLAGSPRRRRVIPWLAGAAIGVAVEIAGMRFFAAPELLPIWLFGLLVALSVGLLLHELGHLAGGKVAGFDFHRILAGPWMLSKESGGYKLRFLPRRILTTAGHTVMIPRTTDNLRRGFALFAAGGPVMTALLFLPVILLPWGPVASCLLAADLVLAFFSWAPMTIGGSATDGKMLRMLAGTGASSDRFAAILYVMAIDNGGVEPRRWPREILDRLAAGAHPDDAGIARAGEFRAEAAILLHIHALDEGETEAVAEALERVLREAGGLRPDLRRAYYVEAAFFQGVYRKNADLARAWLEEARKVKGGVTLKDWDAAPLAAIALAEERWEDARRDLGRAIALLDRMPGAQGSVLAARRRLTQIADGLNAQA